MLRRSLGVAWLVVALTLAWWTADRWWPHAEARVRQAWQRASLGRTVDHALGNIRGAAATTTRGASSAVGALAGATPAAAASAAADPATAPLRKCLQGTAVHYTDQPCPKGSEQAPVAGAVTTLPTRH